MQNIIEKIKNPVSNCLDKVNEEDLKTVLIKGAILSVVMAIINAISLVVTTFTYAWGYYDDYDFSERMERVWNKVENLEVFSGLFQSIIIIAIVIAIVALMLFVIAKVVKSPKKYEETLSMVNSVTIILGIGQIIKMLVSIIYAPLGMIVGIAVGTYAFFTLIETFKESIRIEENDIFVLASTGVITATITIIMILTTFLLKDSLGDITQLFNLMS